MGSSCSQLSIDCDCLKMRDPTHPELRIVNRPQNDSFNKNDIEARLCKSEITRPVGLKLTTSKQAKNIQGTALTRNPQEPETVRQTFEQGKQRLSIKRVDSQLFDDDKGEKNFKSLPLHSQTALVQPKYHSIK